MPFAFPGQAIVGRNGRRMVVGPAVGGSSPVLLMSNRLNLMGWSGYGDSSGTDTDSNTRLSLFNQTGAAVTKAVLYWANWRATPTNEVAGANTITITASVEYPAGTFQQVTFGGSTSTSVVVDELKASDEIAFSVPIPSGAQYWVRTYVSVGAGLKWPLGYLVNTARGEAADFSTGADRTLSGTITNAGASATRRGFGPIGMKATGFVGTPVSRAFATIGDSFGMQAGDGNFDAKGSGGWNGRALTDKYPHVNFAISGTKAADNLPANFTRRKAALDAFGVTDIICTWGHNDLAAGRSVAQIQADFATIWAGWSEFRIHHTTSSPRVTGTYLTAAGQTVATTGGGFAGGVSSRRHLLNVNLRTVPSPLAGVVDLSNAVDVDDNNTLTPGGGKWLSGNGGVGSTNVHVTQTGAATDSTTGDGTHANVTGTNAPFYGGHFVFKDVLEAYLATLP